MSVFHRVDDILSLPGATLWRLAWRLPHYRGCMRDVAERLADTAQSAPPKAVDGTAQTLLTHPDLAANGMYGPLFEIATV